MNKLINEKPDKIGDENEKFYKIFHKFANSNAVFMLEKFQKERVEVREWMSKEDQVEINKMNEMIIKTEKELSEIEENKVWKVIGEVKTENHEQNRRLNRAKLQKELKEYKRKGRGDISWLKKLNVLDFDKEKLARL